MVPPSGVEAIAARSLDISLLYFNIPRCTSAISDCLFISNARIHFSWGALYHEAYHHNFYPQFVSLVSPSRHGTLF